ncbi:MAG: biopolymer transporter ExbD [Phycisphaerae bacterium]
MELPAGTTASEEAIRRELIHRKQQEHKAKLQPPMTPMIDVTFQLLLFFLLTCEFRESEGNIPGTLPAKGNIVQDVQQTPPPEPITIQIRASADRASATYEMTGVPIMITSAQELFQLLKQRQDQLGSDEVPIVILPNEDVPWEFVVEAFNQAVRARYRKIGFAQQIL